MCVRVPVGMWFGSSVPCTTTVKDPGLKVCRPGAEPGRWVGEAGRADQGVRGAVSVFSWTLVRASWGSEPAHGEWGQCGPCGSPHWPCVCAQTRGQPGQGRVPWLDLLHRSSGTREGQAGRGGREVWGGGGQKDRQPGRQSGCGAPRSAHVGGQSRQTLME